MTVQPITLNGVDYITDLVGFERRPMAAQREAQDVGVEAGEQTLIPGTQWKRSQSDWVMGAGQTYFDDPQESDRRRFDMSYNLNVWERRSLTLLPYVYPIRTTANPAFPIGELCSVGDRVYHLENGVVYYLTDVVPGTTGWSGARAGVTGMPNPIGFCMATDGNRVWMRDGVDVYVTDTSTSAATLYSSEATYGLWYAGGWLFATANPEELFTIDGAGVKVPLYTHPDPNWVWQGVVASGSGIYAWGSSPSAGMDDYGPTSAIYSIGVDPATGALTTPVLAAPMPVSEAVCALTFYVGFAIIGTTKGVRVGTVASDKSIQYGPRIDTVLPVTCFETDAEFVSFPVQLEYFAPDLRYGIARLNLSRFVNDLVPAYSEEHEVSSGGDPVDGVVIHGGRIICSIGTGGIYLENESGLPATSGSMVVGRVDYGTPERKRFDSIEVVCEPLPPAVGLSQPKITAWVNDSTGSIMGQLLILDTPGQTRKRVSFNVVGAAGERVGEWAEVNLTIDAPSGTVAPEVLRWTLRATPVMFRVEELYVPVILSSEATDHLGYEHRQTPLEVLTALTDLFQSRETVVLTIGGESLEVIVDGVFMSGNDPATMVTEWTDDSTYLNGIVRVKFVTVEPSTFD